MNETSNSSNGKLAFYVKCRPQDADAELLCRKFSRVFIGYPPWRTGSAWDRHNVQQSILDISVGDAAWRPSEIRDDIKGGPRRQIARNRRFALTVEPGSIAVVPRPQKGVCLIAHIQNKFELVNDPSWAEEYLALRKEQGLKDEPEYEQCLIGDVVQSWSLDHFRDVPFPKIPRWISYSLLSRNTIGWINDRPDGRRLAVDLLDELHRGTFKVSLEPTIDPGEVEGRLLDWISPNMLEHLVCALLQLEQPDVRWFHIGGAGDGGADGLAMNTDSQVTAALTCKWKFDGDPYQLGEGLLGPLRKEWPNARVHIAVLYNKHEEDYSQKDVILWGRHRIAELLIKHRSACPMAKTLGVA